MFSYIGGKFYLKDWIIEHIPEHTCYVEVFGGAGWVLLFKPKSKVEVYNDKDNNVYNIFYCLKYYRQELIRYIKNSISSRKEFEYYYNKIKKNDFIDDVERAFAWLYVYANSFSGKISSYSYSKTKRNNFCALMRKIIQFRDRLKDVYLENLDFEEVINRYDSENTFFYLDPPYWGAEGYYNTSFTKDDHIRLANKLTKIKGKFLLSYYDNPILNEYYSKYNIDRKFIHKFSYGVTRFSKRETKPMGEELLIYNYSLNKMRRYEKNNLFSVVY